MLGSPVLVIPSCELRGLAPGAIATARAAAARAKTLLERSAEQLGWSAHSVHRVLLGAAA
ncbi:hypothetical protein [Roseateles sp.]|uniref:hypothetical protein n=1 Tax=Roseateles sp. TaxID=1971397 RepID=UPI0025D9D8F9|nr:hypothetical protein [Roseateles sp.]MBV8033616.1 hypothetical protein [Roseateles sp.]